MLRNVEHQTPEICLATVKKNGLALEFVTHQTEEICLAAVEENVAALAHVEELTPRLCIAAFTRYGAKALDYMHVKQKLKSEESVMIKSVPFQIGHDQPEVRACRRDNVNDKNNYNGNEKKPTKSSATEKKPILNEFSKPGLYTDEESIKRLAEMGLEWNPYYESKIMSRYMPFAN